MSHMVIGRSEIGQMVIEWEEMGQKDGGGENGRTGERENGRTGERENGRTGERENGRMGERNR